jgi:hypothetical protein
MLDKVIELAERFDVFDRVKKLLLAQPDKANQKLAEVLDELTKTVGALEAEMVRYLNLEFQPGVSITPGRGVLLEMEGGQSMIRINETRGHCHKIKSIYDTYLNPWFDRVFKEKNSERNELDTMFGGVGGLNDSDDYIIEAMKEVSAWLKAQATQILGILDAGNLSDANDKLKQARLAAKPAREKLVETMSKLRGFQADLIKQLRTL